MKALNNISNVSLGIVLRNFLIIVVYICFFCINLNGQTSTINGNWATNSTWGGVTAPSSTINSGVTVVIAAGDTVTLSSKLDVKSNATLDVYGYLIVTNLNGIVFWNGCNVIIHSGGTLKCETGVTNNNASGISVNGSLICLGDYTAGNGSVMDGAGTIQVQGTLTVEGSADVLGVANPGCSSCNVSESGIADAAIYSEDFSNDVGKGWTSSYLSPDDSNWSLQKIGSPDLNNSNDHCKVNTGYLEWKDNNGNTSNRIDWFSKIINGDYHSVLVEIPYSVKGSAYTASLKAYYKIDGGSWVQFGSKTTTSYTGETGVFLVDNLIFASSFHLKVEGFTGNNSSCIAQIDNIKIYGIQNITPIISTSVSLSAFSACSGANSATQNFSVSGTNMSAGILVNPPAGYEVSTTFDFSSNVGTNGSGITVGSSGTIASTTIYVRTTTSATNGAGGNIELTSAGATQVNVVTGSATISSNTYYVSTSGSNSNNGLTSGTAFATLQKAIDMVGSSCASTTINVAAGTYNENGVLISNKSNINIVGAGISSTIFSGGHTNRFMGITGTSDNISISNMQIYQMDEGTVNGTYSGGGMYISCSGTVDLTSLHFEGCRCDVNGGSGGGGAIYVGSSASVNIYKSLFESNRNSRTHSSQDGGAICNTGTIHIENSLFYNNAHETSNGYDGVIVFKGGGDGTIVNSTITKNFNNTNGRIPIYVDGSGSTVTILNSILYGYPGSYDIRKNSTPTIKSINCIGYTGNVWDGTVTNCYTTTDFGFSDLGSYDFSLASSSYCKDKGTSSISSPVSLTAPSDDFAGTTRSGNPDVGCYELVSNTWTGASSTAWTTTGNWSLGVLPTSADVITITDVSNQPIISSDVTLAGLTIDSGADITISSNSLTVTGAIDLNGTLNIGNATVNADGTFDATGGVIDFTNAGGKLVLSSTVTSLGTLDEAMGTIEYDGGTQTVVSDSYYNLIISSAGKKTAAGNLIVNGNLSSAATAGCKLDMGAYALNIAGNLTVGATDGLDLSDASCLLTIDGSSDQSITHAGVTVGSGSELTNLSINKASGNVILNSEISVGGTIAFTSGIIDATSNDLTFTSSATVTGASDASHVKGVVNKNTASTSQFIFPIGDGTTYSPIAITPNATSSTDWEVSYSNAAYSDLSIDASGLDHVSSNEYWDLNRVSGTADAVVDIWWTSSDAVTDYTDLAIAHYNGTDWEMIATSPYGTNSSGYIRSQGPVTSFSPFTIGTTSNVNALPVGIVMFEGKEENLKNKLLWQVASEKNVDHFIVEKTKDGEFFEFVGSLISEQSDLEIHNYSLMDEKVDPIINYYRLIAVDLNGVHINYNLISIDNRSMVVEKELLKITNMWGQDVQPGYKGQVIYIYTDGSIERKIKF